MRELTTLASQQHAERLAGYLVTQSIPCSVEEEEGQWVVWVVNDDDRDTAQKVLEEFRENPEDFRYDAALVQARKLAKKESESRKTIRQRQVDLNKRWNGHWWYAHPVTTILIVISVLVAVICTDWSNAKPGMLGLPALCTNEESPLLRRMYIAEFTIDVRDGREWIHYSPSPWTAVLRGEIWRLLTPMFVHFGVLHILFNMIWMKQLASAVEFVKGSRHFLALVLLLEVPSSLAQFYWSGPAFGGMSGVVFGMIGYVWMKGKTQPHEGLSLMPQTVIYCFLWLFLCMGGAVGSIANAAHLVGLVVGMILGARQALWKSLIRHIGS